MRLFRRRCPYAATCELRHHENLRLAPTMWGARLVPSGRWNRFVLVCPYRRSCPLRDAADGGLVRIHPDGVEVRGPESS